MKSEQPLKLTILVDNNTLIDRYFFAEPGLSIHIQDDDINLLFDVGYSDIFLKNAQKMNIFLSQLDYVAISHGHLDHTWGLESLIKYYTERIIEHLPHKTPTVLGHPNTFLSVTFAGIPEIGSNISENKLKKHFNLSLKREPQWITANLVYLGEIPRLNQFEVNHALGYKENEEKEDYIPEDTALVYKSSQGLVIITGCSHSGICNIIEYAKDICSEKKIYDIIGGFHLLNPSHEQVSGTLDYLKGADVNRIHPCHCTDLKSKIQLSTVIPIEEVGVGLVLNY